MANTPVKTVITLFRTVTTSVSEGAAIPQNDVEPSGRYLLVETSDGGYSLEDLESRPVEATASESDVTYQFFSKSNTKTPVTIKSTEASPLKTTAFKITMDTVFIVHGWRNDNESLVNYEIKEALLPKYDANVFVVDWSRLAKKNYVTAKNAVTAVGGFVAKFLQTLQASYGLNFSRTMLVGHSLGAHVCGNAGAALGGLVKHIVGMDPAFPLFSYSNTDNRLDTTDARFVEVIHTNGGLLGFSASIGHMDYFPNGGSRQPGCGLNATGSCAHSRSYKYYAESVLASKNAFVATTCTSYKDYSKGRCSANARSLMGGYAVDTTARGDYYLDTNSASPFAKG
ncbi:hypothetical protein NQ318_021555 [Aromia moschata]|uniref:Lipase domain-containing protein n=1 Tax=Aromia moschata TaxID=1265417 RepID=A0AAV8YIX1_9CUCU|nr:hypothetical protein NQ318_021555 [Aromia moschata]